MASPSAVEAATVYNVDRTSVAIKGYDPVAYFTQKMPVKGSDMYELEWEGAKWRFASMANLDLFRGDPAKYAPRYGGYCAYGVAVGGLYNIKPEAWSIVDGTLYLNKNLRIRETWRKDIPGYIEKADANWPGLKGK
jgi:YHS domain-containing protein